MDERQDRSAHLQRLIKAHADGTSEDGLSPGPEEVKALLHELQVYQAELEAQVEELRETQAKLEEAHQHWFSLYHEAPVGYLTLDASGMITRANRTFVDLVGGSAQQVERRAFQRFLRQDSSDRFLMGFQAMYRAPEGRVQEVFLERSDGRTCCLRLTGRRVGKELHLMTTDVTDRYQSERDLIEVQETLRAIFSAAPDAIFMVDGLGRICHINPAGTALVGVGQAALGRSIRPFLPELLDGVAVSKTLDVLMSAQAMVTRFVNGEDESIAVEIVAGRARSDERVILLVRDIRDRLKLERQLRQAQRMEVVGRLTAGVAHNFNNILQVVLVGLEYAMRSSGKGPLESAMEAALQAAKVVRELLVFSRGEETVHVPLPVREVVQSAERIAGHILGEQCTLEVSEEATGLWIEGDESQLGQVLINLLVNARDALLEARGRGRIRLVVSLEVVTGHPFAEQDGDHVCLSIEDDGPGIAPGTREMIFEPFFTTKGPDRGTGLGLSTAIGIVRTHRGWIDCDASSMGGARFRVFLPRIEARAPTPPGPLSVTMARVHRDVRLCFIDDDELLRRNLALLLTAQGVNVHECTSAEEALAMDDPRFDAYIVDLCMPGMDGRVFVETLRERGDQTPVVVMTGLGNQERVPGAQAVLGKPILIDAMMRAIEKVL